MSALEGAAWPVQRWAEALACLGRHAGFPIRAAAPAPPPPASVAHELDQDATEKWIEALGAWLGLDAEAVEAQYGGIDDLLRRAGPALVRLPGQGTAIALAGSRGGELEIIGPEGAVRRIPSSALRDELIRPLEEVVAGELDAWLVPLMGRGAATDRARRALLDERTRSARIAGINLVRLPTGGSFWAQVRAEGIGKRIATFLAAHLAHMAVTIAAWWMLGSGALQGRLEPSLLVAWAFLLVSMVPLRLASSWAQGRVAIDAGKLVKKRLLAGALRIDADVVRREGSGQLLGRAMESAAIEGLAIDAGLSAVLALVELVVVFGVLGAGRGGVLSVGLLGACAAVTLVVGFQSYRLTARLTEIRREMTDDLVEQMVGHATRLAQQHPRRWHDGEDEILERYLDRGRAMDRKNAFLALVPSLFLVAALIGLLPTFTAGGTLGSFAVSLGGVLLAGGALSRLTGGLGALAAVAIAWKQVAPLAQAAARPAIVPSPTLALPHGPIRRGYGQPRPVVLDAADLTFSYPGRPEPAVVAASLRVELGDRILLEGPSGSGKSTLAAILTGLEQPSSGLLLLDGLDRHTLGEDGWRKRVVTAPQFHDNHVLTETLAYNLLMGRRWPPTPQDLRAAEDVCEALGLGDLLRRMPSGLMQMVGESGWRLSHGERSRVFIARALLQDAHLVVLDESFAALDPETLDRCLRTVLDRAHTLMVVAHP